MKRESSKRVVVTGLGVCAPGASNPTELHELLSSERSAVRFFPELKDLGFGCQIGAKPSINQEVLEDYFDRPWLKNLNSWGLIYGVLAGADAWKDAGLSWHSERRDSSSGIVFGAGVLGVDKLREAIGKVDEGQVRRLGSTTVLQTMTSGVSAYLAGVLGCGNRVSTNSSACSTGTEAAVLGYHWIKQGHAERMLVGSTSEGGPYVWGGFDAMRVLPRNFNDQAEKGSRPLSASAAGFVPSCGAGALVIESLEAAQARGAKIYAEICSGVVNSGGQRGGGSFTAPNPSAIQECIAQTIEKSGLALEELDTINGHLTATKGDVQEALAWKKVFSSCELPLINSFKGHLGHALAAAGSIELVGSVLQLDNQVVYGTLNAEDLHPEIEKIGKNSFPVKQKRRNISSLIKASFGFGDVNACLTFRKWPDQ